MNIHDNLEHGPLAFHEWLKAGTIEDISFAIQIYLLEHKLLECMAMVNYVTFKELRK